MTYPSEVLADSPYAYWRMGDTGTPWQDATAGNRDMTADATFDITGALQGAQEDGAAQFNGTDDAGSVALDLSDATAITVEMFLWWDAYANDDDLAFEFTPTWNSNAGGFICDPNNSTGAPEANTISFGFGSTSPGVRVRGTVPRADMPAAQWNHTAWVLHRTGPVLKAYVNGSAVTVTMRESGTGEAFANSTFYLMSRNAASLRGAGRVDELAIYKSELSAARIAAHYAARGESVPTTSGRVPTLPTLPMLPTLFFNG